jgi:3-deoxy-7-phosphoheptulonate synthase
MAAPQRADLRVSWICDPMHGNTEKTKSGLKTRRFDAILSELTETFRVHERERERLQRCLRHRQQW